MTGDAEQVIRLGYPPSPHQTQRSGDVQTLSTAHQRYLEVEDQKILRTHHPISGASPSHQNSTNSQVHASRGTRGAVMSNSTVRHCNLSLSRNCCLDERQSRHLHAKPINTAYRRQFDRFGIGVLDPPTHPAIAMLSLEYQYSSTKPSGIGHKPI